MYNCEYVNYIATYNAMHMYVHAYYVDLVSLLICTLVCCLDNASHNFDFNTAIQ